MNKDDINPFAEESLNDQEDLTLNSSQSSAEIQPEYPETEEPPPIPTKRPTYPEPPNYREAKQKTEFCCERDIWLHSDESVEIKVRLI